MDPITLIVTALVAGASKVAGEAATDAYRHLLAAVRRHFADDQHAKDALDEHMKDPHGWEAPLRKCLTDRRADTNAEVTGAAQAVLAAVEQHRRDAGVAVTGGSVNITSGATVYNVGGMANAVHKASR